MREGSLAVLRAQPRARWRCDQPAAAEARLHKHRGKAVVFESYDALRKASTIRRSTSTRTASSC
jgi:hypothetical protein